MTFEMAFALARHGAKIRREYWTQSSYWTIGGNKFEMAGRFSNAEPTLSTENLFATDWTATGLTFEHAFGPLSLGNPIRRTSWPAFTRVEFTEGRMFKIEGETRTPFEYMTEDELTSEDWEILLPNA